MISQTEKTEAPWSEIVDRKILQSLELDSLTAASPLESFYDLAVIGGGIAGLSAAQAASKSGARVILLERAPALASGASGKNAGILGAGVNTPLVHMPKEHPAMSMWKQTSDLLPELYKSASQKNSGLIAKKVGALSLAKSETACKRLIREAKARSAAGLNAEIVSPVQVADLTFDLLDLRDVVAALYLPDEGRINPLTLLASLARQSRENGCTLFGGAEIIERSEISAASFSRSHGSIGVDHQAKASFPPSGKLWRLSTTSNIDIFAASVIYATGPIINANRRIYAVSFRIELPELFPLFWDAAPFTYYDYRSGEGFITVTGGRYGTAGQINNDHRFHSAMISVAKNWMPALRNSLPSHLWAVNLEVTADMMPQIHTVAESPIALSIEGLGALGVLPGMVLGKEAGEKTVAK